MEGQNFFCEICSRRFLSETTFTKHLDFHTSGVVFECGQCLKVFSTKGNLRKHTRLHQARSSFPCEICSKTFSDKGNLSKHIHAMHQQKQLFKCSVCGKMFKFKGNILKHMKTHSKDVHMMYSSQGEKPIKQIRSGFMSLDVFDKTKMKFLCSFCGQEFQDYSSIKEHQYSHKVRRKPLTCEVCDKVVLGKDNLARHMTTHRGLRPYQCDKCFKFFSRKDILKSHKKIHEKQLSCSICDESKTLTFKSELRLNAHMKLHHGEDSTCPICCKTFKHRSSLLRHSNTHSEVEKQFKYSCEKCEVKFYRKDSFVKHTKNCTSKKVKQLIDCDYQKIENQSDETTSLDRCLSPGGSCNEMTKVLEKTGDKVTIKHSGWGDGDSRKQTGRSSGRLTKKKTVFDL